MFGWFKGRRRVGNLTDRAAVKITRCIRMMQEGFAKNMNKRTKGFSKRTWLVLIFVCGAGWGALSVYFIVNALTGDHDVHTVVPVRRRFAPAKKDSLVFWEEMYKQRKLKK